MQLAMTNCHQQVDTNSSKLLLVNGWWYTHSQSVSQRLITDSVAWWSWLLL